MSTRTAALPIERRYLARASVAVSAIVIAATAVVVMTVSFSGGPAAGEGARTDVTGRISEVADYGPPSGTHGPIQVNGAACGRCR